MPPAAKIRPLSPEIQKHGFVYQFHQRTGRVAVYKVCSKGGGIFGWEVILIRVAKAAKLPNGKTVPTREVYPSSEEFGSHAWFYSPSQEEKMLAKFSELVSSHGEA